MEQFGAGAIRGSVDELVKAGVIDAPQVFRMGDILIDQEGNVIGPVAGTRFVPAKEES